MQWLCMCTLFIYLSRWLLGQIISNKKEELMSILDHFNIQVSHAVLLFMMFTIVLYINSLMITSWNYANPLSAQVDNPVSILNQEMSKQFLHSKSEADKYKVTVQTFIYLFIFPGICISPFHGDDDQFLFWNDVTG